MDGWIDLLEINKWMDERMERWNPRFLGGDDDDDDDSVLLFSLLMRHLTPLEKNL